MLDLISRKDAISVLQKEINKFIPPLNDSDWWMRYGIRLSRNIIEDLSTVGSIPVKSGKWVKTGQSFVYPHKFLNYSCSVCGYDIEKTKFNYCPNCGVRMEEKDE